VRLEELARRALAAGRDTPAVVGPDGSMTYAELDRAANQVANALRELGVQRGDRVAVSCTKSARAVAVLQGVLRASAAYVPIDARSPKAVTERILDDSGAAALVATERVIVSLDPRFSRVPTISLDGSGGTIAWEALARYPVGAPEVSGDDADLAYILYTSGSTGVPKGVAISHRAALAFVNWAIDELRANASDRFANHAPFHFDLSVLDLYAAFGSGGTVVLVPEGSAYAPAQLVDFIHREGISIWYSVPSALTLMLEQGGLLERRPPALRAVLFAGEPFNVKGLRALYNAFKGVRLLNLYGPTETNVCTFYEVVTLEEERTAPVPIGKGCCGDRVWATRDDGQLATAGEEGELFVEGPTLMEGYFGREPQQGPYATGDIVRLLADGNYEFVGRRDHLVKVRGYRVELGAIEATLMRLPGVRDVAVVTTGEGIDTLLVAYVVSDIPPSLLAIKRHCATHLPRHMIVDRSHAVASLPRTPNGKVDRKRLASGVLTDA
jgi:amino acid adenylation domain-containing protein